MNIWPKTRPTQEQKVGWRTITTKWFRDPDGNEQEYSLYDRDGARAVAVIALTLDNRVIIAEQFRPGPEKVMYELPGGVVDKNEAIEVAALRELREETGYTSERIEHLGAVYKSAYMCATWDYFFAQDCAKIGQQETDEGEFVDVKTITIEELFAHGRNANLTDTEALFLAYEKLRAAQHEQKEVR